MSDYDNNEKGLHALLDGAEGRLEAEMRAVTGRHSITTDTDEDALRAAFDDVKGAVRRALAPLADAGVSLAFAAPEGVAPPPYGESLPEGLWLHAATGFLPTVNLWVSWGQMALHREYIVSGWPGILLAYADAEDPVDAELDGIPDLDGMLDELMEYLGEGE